VATGEDSPFKGLILIRAGPELPDDVVKVGAVGQLITRGPSLLKEYFKLPDKTAAALHGGWFYSGDASYVDDEGFVYVLGRLDHTIKSSGELLFTHPGRRQRRRRGAAQPQVGPGPRHYLFVAEILANPTGKVDRGTLKDKLLAMLAGPLE
jgi:fatty-acyl-CoA synthase